jgi:AcrR family transcriptional regulator
LKELADKMTNGITESSARAAYHHGGLREALLAAAEQELKEKGVEGFTLRGCARRAGVSHAAPAHHFRDADALLTALAGVGFARFTAAMEARREAAPADARERLLAIGLGYIDFATREPALFRLMFASGRPDFEDPELHWAASKAFDLLVGAVASARDDAGADQSPIVDIGAAWSIVHGIAVLALSGRMKFMDEISSPAEREATYRSIIGRVLPRAGF